ncbi:AI-2E family transporter [Bythopirellula polymerisocia]|uniref:AI-2 transport protein TqsA n=1 Tax=Bythopirellula polymerisocia TaxID=2528003 RepID=A0A5C6CRY0_9BACT|nr:AI-2E family transporter [Bythopirellula polymerisocia]TWU27683.1 AI-2 transport protein TqsA [Bythopirellula polymerisocia]
MPTAVPTLTPQAPCCGGIVNEVDQDKPALPEPVIPEIESTQNSPQNSDAEFQDAAHSWDLKDALLATLAVLAVFYTIYFTRSILFPITLAVLLNLVFKPIVLRMQDFRIPAAVSATFILVAFVITVIAGIWLLWEPANQRIAQISSPGYVARLKENLKPLQKPFKGLNEASKKIDEITNVTDEDTPIKVQNGTDEDTPMKVQQVQPKLGSMLNLTGSFVASAVIVFVLLFFLLAGGDRFLEKLVVLMPTFKDKRRVVELSREVQHRISHYLFTITAINVGLGIAIGIGMWAIDLPNPVLWGVMGAMLNYIPFAGPAVGALIVFLEGLADFNSLGHAALAPAIYIGLNALESNFFTPALLGKSISLNPVMIVLAIFFWGWLWGVGGVLVAVPLLVVLKIFFDQSQVLAPLGTFLEK